MKRKISGIITLVFLCVSVFAQNTVFDSLKQKLNDCEEKQRVDVLLDLADYMADSTHYNKEVNSYLDEALNISKQNKDTSNITRTLNYYGIAALAIGNYELTTDYYFKALSLAESSHDTEMIAILNHNLGMVFDELEEYDEAISYYEKSLEHDLQNKDTLGLINCYINLSISYQNKLEYKKAEEFAFVANDLAVAKNDSASIVLIINNLGTIYYDTKDYDKSLKFYQEALDYYSRIGDRDGIATAYNNFGLIYLDKKEFEKAKEYLFKALKIAKELDLYDFTGDIYSNLTIYFEAIEDYKNAYYYYDQFNIVYDSLIGEKKNKLIRQLEAKYDFEKKQRKILELEAKTSIQQKEIKNVKLVQFYLVAITLVVVVLLVFVIRILSKEKKLSIELKNKTEQLRKLNVSKDKFFSIVAHDLRNPFHALVGYTDLLKNNFDDFERDEIKQILQDLNESTEQGFNLLQNLLFWSRAQTDRLKVFKTKFDIVELVNEVIQLTKLNAQKKQQSIISHFDADCLVMADKDMVSTIIRNLIFNAIKFSYVNSKIEVRVQKSNNSIFVSVSDNGVGISEDKIDKIFRIDENTSTSGTSGEPGSGLGLILCKEFVEKNNGKLTVESIVGQGATFTFNLPCASTISKDV